MISVKRCTATSISASHHHHHQQHGNSHQHQRHPIQNAPTVPQVRSSSAGRAASAGSGSNNNNRLIRSRNSPYLSANGYSSGGSPGGGPDRAAAANGYSIITNGGSLYYSNNSVLGTKSQSSVLGGAASGGDIFELDSLFLVPKCALTYDKAMSLRKDLAAYDFNIRILEDTPKGNVWICKCCFIFPYVSVYVSGPIRTWVCTSGNIRVPPWVNMWPAVGFERLKTVNHM